MNSATLVLEDATVFKGESIGVNGVAIGPLFFDTRVVGYQGVITDPANAGKILIFTYPLIGNYGVNPKFNESERTQVKGIIIKEKSQTYSNWQAKASFDDFLKRENLMAISEIDTRTLAVHLREKGEMWAGISTHGDNAEELIAEIKRYKQKKSKSFIRGISTPKIRVIRGKTKTRVGILDLGVMRDFIQQLNRLGLEVVLLPYNTPMDEILKLKLKGLIISSGPEEDAVLDDILPTIKNIVGKLPVLGIALGAQLIAKSWGAKIKQMHLGHHGVNYPIKYPSSHKGDITVQNHSYVVDLDSLKKIKEIQITALHLNDGTVEEFGSKKYKFMAVQYYPASPGFDEVNSIFTKFSQLMKGKN